MGKAHYRSWQTSPGNVWQSHAEGDRAVVGRYGWSVADEAIRLVSDAEM